MIRLFVMDVDGTMTDGRLYYGNDGEVHKAFDVKDGYALALLPSVGVKTAIITGRESAIVERRAENLRISIVRQGAAKKLEVLRSLWKEYGISAAETAYIGDDLNDLPCIREVGRSACPSDAMVLVKEGVDYVCTNPGGRGCVREFIDRLIEEGEIRNPYDL